MQCIVCWHDGDLDLDTHKHKECMNFNRRTCCKCLKAIKVPIDDVQMNCNYCAVGGHELIDEIPYQKYDSYSSKYRINKIDRENIVLCNECFVPNKNRNTFDMCIKCDLCRKYSNSCININRQYFLETQQNVNGIYCEIKN